MAEAVGRVPGSSGAVRAGSARVRRRYTAVSARVPPVSVVAGCAARRRGPSGQSTDLASGRLGTLDPEHEPARRAAVRRLTSCPTGLGWWPVGEHGRAISGVNRRERRAFTAGAAGTCSARRNGPVAARPVAPAVTVPSRRRSGVGAPAGAAPQTAAVAVSRSARLRATRHRGRAGSRRLASLSLVMAGGWSARDSDARAQWRCGVAVVVAGTRATCRELGRRGRDPGQLCRRRRAGGPATSRPRHLASALPQPAAASRSQRSTAAAPAAGRWRGRGEMAGPGETAVGLDDHGLGGERLYAAGGGGWR